MLSRGRRPSCPCRNGDGWSGGSNRHLRPASAAAGFPARSGASADQLARLHVAARGRHRTRRVGATRRCSEERAAHMDRVWRRPDVRRRRPGRCSFRTNSAVRRTRGMARSAAISSAASTGRRQRPLAQRASPASCLTRRRCRTPTGRCRQTARATGAPSRGAVSGCRFQASTACRPARICRS